jgi:hypothetical protein
MLVVPIIFKQIEETGLSMWIRDSPSFFAYWFILSFHAIGMGLLVGASVVLDLRILGVARELPITPLKGLNRIMWFGFWIQIISGALLLTAYPTKAFTNIDFYIKMTFVTAAVITMSKLNKRIFSNPDLSDSEMMSKGRQLAQLSLFFWVVAVTAGRLLAYTYQWLKYDYRG